MWVSNDYEVENVKNIDCISLYDENDLKKYNFIEERFPDINKKMTFTEEGFQLFMKITADINKKNKEDAVKAEDVFNYFKIKMSGLTQENLYVIYLNNKLSLIDIKLITTGTIAQNRQPGAAANQSQTENRRHSADHGRQSDELRQGHQPTATRYLRRQAESICSGHSPFCTRR